MALAVVLLLLLASVCVRVRTAIESVHACLPLAVPRILSPSTVVVCVAAFTPRMSRAQRPIAVCERMRGIVNRARGDCDWCVVFMSVRGGWGVERRERERHEALQMTAARFPQAARAAQRNPPASIQRARGKDRMEIHNLPEVRPRYRSRSSTNQMPAFPSCGNARVTYGLAHIAGSYVPPKCGNARATYGLSHIAGSYVTPHAFLNDSLVFFVMDPTLPPPLPYAPYPRLTITQSLCPHCIVLAPIYPHTAAQPAARRSIRFYSRL